MAALNEAADRETEPVAKGKLRVAAGAVGDVGKSVVAEIIARVIMGGT